MDEKPRIMIVDDNPRARMALSACLSMLDAIEIIGEASNGEDAVQKVESQSPDMVLMDLQMPGMDGLQATRAIKERWPQIKVIVLTIYADALCPARQAGADAFLVKGCPLEELLSVVAGFGKEDQEDIPACKG
jgi:DNA-binding NarL/FixJ family response regulator